MTTLAQKTGIPDRTEQVPSTFRRLTAVLTAWIGRVVVAGVFGYAAISKILDPAAFNTAIQLYELTPTWASRLSAVWLPWLELFSAFALLLVPGWRRAAAVVLVGLLLVFTAAIVSAMARGLAINCGCFGQSAEVVGIGWPQLGRNAALIGLTIAAAWAMEDEPSRRWIRLRL